MRQFGIFSDEGLLAGEFYSRAQAEAALAANYVDDGVHVAEVCPEHEDEERDSCSECNNENEE